MEIIHKQKNTTILAIPQLEWYYLDAKYLYIMVLCICNKKIIYIRLTNQETTPLLPATIVKEEIPFPDYYTIF